MSKKADTKKKKVDVKKIPEKKKLNKEIKTVNDLSKIEDMRTTVNVDIEGTKMSGDFREFSSGSKGYYVSGKVMIDGVKCQVGCNIIVIGSKPEVKK